MTSPIRSSRPGSPQPARLGVVVRFHPFRCSVHKGTCGSPKFPENPIVPLPCSQTPVKPWCLAFTAPRYCPRHRDEEGLNNIAAFGALSPGLSTGCLRFVPPSLATTQNSLPGGGRPFPGGIPVYPLSSGGKFPPLGFLFPWALLGATPFLLFPAPFQHSSFQIFSCPPVPTPPFSPQTLAFSLHPRLLPSCPMNVAVPRALC